MSLAALLLVVAAAVFHAGWNFLAKRAGGGAAFVWLFGVVSATLYTPIALWSSRSACCARCPISGCSAPLTRLRCTLR